MATKPVPALCLAALVLSGRDTYARWVGAGLLLSAVGDVLLEIPKHFVPGLLAFLLAHLAYTRAFLSDERRLRLARALPFVAWVVAAGAWLWPGLGDMKPAVAAYMAAIAAMMWRAAARVSPGGRAAWAGAVGAALFGLSDTLIAADRFHAPIAGVRYAIILLYWAGQAGIAASAFRRQG